MAKSGGGVQIEKYCKDTQLIDFKRLTYTHADDSRTLVSQYIERQNVVFDELFSPIERGRRDGHVITPCAMEEYDGLRDLVSLQSDTRLKHTLVFCIDEFWGVGENAVRLGANSGASAALAPRWLVDQSGYFTESTCDADGKADEAVDPYHIFQRTEATKKSKRRRRLDCFTSYYEDTVPQWNAEGGGRIDRIPFTWDFGFLLLRRQPWLEALRWDRSAPSFGGFSLRRIWGGIPKVVDSAQTASAGETWTGSRPNWLQFLRACRYVADVQSELTGAPIAAFDVSMRAIESFSCLLLEVWASIIEERSHKDQTLDKFRIQDQFRSAATDEGLVQWVEQYPIELFMAWLLLAETLQVPSFRRKLPEEEHANGSAVPDEFSFVQRPMLQRAIAARHWYVSASEEPFQRTEDPAEHFVVAGLPGRYSVRGDWFLAAAAGSQSRRLAGRATDLLSSRRANIERLQLGLGLPVRDDIAKSDTTRQSSEGLRTGLITTTDRGQRNVLYSEFKSLGAMTSGGAPVFYWLWRSKLRDYDLHARVWRKWQLRVLNNLDDIRIQEGRNWNGFDIYQEFNKTFRRPLSIDQLQKRRSKSAVRLLARDDWKAFIGSCQSLTDLLRNMSSDRSGDDDSG